MPQLGEIKIGHKNTKYQKFVWQACPDCGKEQWVELLARGKPTSIRCRVCSNKGARNPMWKGGRLRTNCGRGYVKVWVHPDDPLHAMSKDGNNYVPEHRLVMAQSLGRPLKKGEIVHHLNGIRDDNRLENLALTSLSEHQHNTLAKCFQVRIRELEEKLQENSVEDLH